MMVVYSDFPGLLWLFWFFMIVVFLSDSSFSPWWSLVFLMIHSPHVVLSLMSTHFCSLSFCLASARVPTSARTRKLWLHNVIMPLVMILVVLIKSILAIKVHVVAVFWWSGNYPDSQCRLMRCIGSNSLPACSQGSISGGKRDQWVLRLSATMLVILLMQVSSSSNQQSFRMCRKDTRLTVVDGHSQLVLKRWMWFLICDQALKYGSEMRGVGGGR